MFLGGFLYLLSFGIWSPREFEGSLITYLVVSLLLGITVFKRVQCCPLSYETVMKKVKCCFIVPVPHEKQIEQ